MKYLGDFAPGATVHIKFATNTAAGARGGFSDALEANDIRVYKDGSATERASTSGFTVTSGFDSLTGIHHVAIDLSDNTDAGFYAAGHDYQVILYPDTETVDSQAPAAVLAQFSIDNRRAGLDLTRVTAPTANSAFPLGTLWYGTLSAIDATSVTLPGGHGLDHQGNYAVVLVSGTAATGRGRFLKYNSAEKWDVSPAWNSDGETTPSGAVVAMVVPAPKVPTDATLIPAVTVSDKTGFSLSTAYDGIKMAANGGFVLP